MSVDRKYFVESHCGLVNFIASNDRSFYFLKQWWFLCKSNGKSLNSMRSALRRFNINLGPVTEIEVFSWLAQNESFLIRLNIYKDSSYNWKIKSCYKSVEMTTKKNLFRMEVYSFSQAEIKTLSLWIFYSKNQEINRLRLRVNLSTRLTRRKQRGNSSGWKEDGKDEETPYQYLSLWSQIRKLTKFNT